MASDREESSFGDSDSFAPVPKEQCEKIRWYANAYDENRNPAPGGKVQFIKWKRGQLLEHFFQCLVIHYNCDDEWQAAEVNCKHNIYGVSFHIFVQGVVSRYQDRMNMRIPRILDDFLSRRRQGRVTVIYGPRRVGKTTVVNHALGALLDAASQDLGRQRATGNDIRLRNLLSSQERADEIVAEFQRYNGVKSNGGGKGHRIQ